MDLYLPIWIINDHKVIFAQLFFSWSDWWSQTICFLIRCTTTCVFNEQCSFLVQLIIQCSFQDVLLKVGPPLGKCFWVEANVSVAHSAHHRWRKVGWHHVHCRRLAGLWVCSLCATFLLPPFFCSSSPAVCPAALFSIMSFWTGKEIWFLELKQHFVLWSSTSVWSPEIRLSPSWWNLCSCSLSLNLSPAHSIWARGMES